MITRSAIQRVVGPVRRAYRSLCTATHYTVYPLGRSHIVSVQHQRLPCIDAALHKLPARFISSPSSCTYLSSRFHSTMTSPEGRQILPDNVKPIQYYLTLEPLFDTFTFNGDETIDLSVKKDSDEISLNTLELELKDVEIVTGEGNIIKPTSIDEDVDENVTTFKLPETLKAGTIVNLKIKFVGILNDKMAGFYRSTYKEDGKTKYLATTQMEPVDCRRAFPCFDEPNLKAKFAISLIGDKKLTFLSNMDVKDEESLSETKKKVNFNVTPPMSTYLVAFIVGDLTYVESSYKFRDVTVRCYSTPGYEKKTQFSADLGAKALEYYEQCFDIKYPLPKMDMVAIHDFSAGAMENWGLVTYRMVDLLYDEDKSTVDTKLRVTEVVAHELAHQWFGNYCTIDFWDSLWLNESFATYMSWKCTNHFYPDWKVWENFVGESLQYALTLDGLRSSHPIEVPVKRADEINQIFDAISYEKGSSVLHMLANWLGEDVFIKGVSKYLKKHAYSNAVTSALWEALADVSGKDVESTMKVWTEKVGYPLISVTESKTGISLEQHRFLTAGNIKPSDDETIYPIFVGLKTDKGLDESIVLDKRTMDVPLDTSAFYKVNGNSNGVYRVNYLPKQWAKLGLSASKLSAEDRIGLVADAGALAVPGFSKTSNLLSLVSGWKTESNVFVWDEIISRLGALKSAWIFEDETTKEAIKKLTLDLVGDKAHSVGYKFAKADSFLDQKLKGILFSTAVSNGDPVTLDAANKMFSAYVGGDSTALHPNLRASVFNSIASNGGEKEYEELISIYNKPQSEDEKIAALRSLGRFQDEKLLVKVLDLLLDGTVRAQDCYIPMQGMRAHKVGIETLYGWVTKHWDVLTKLLPPGLSMLGSVVQLATTGFCTQKQYDTVEAFFKDKDTKGYNQSLAQSLETIKNKTAWVERDSSDVEKWLKEKGYLG